MNLKVSKIQEENHNTRTLYFQDAEEAGRAFDYVAAQYLTFRFDNLADKPVVRSYTMSSAPKVDLDDIAVTVKEVEDGFISTHLVKKVQVGDILRARGPIGRFGYHHGTDHPHLCMIAAGSGVTPFLSLLREHQASIHQENSPQKMTLIVSYRSQTDLIAWEMLQELNKIPGIEIIVSLSREKAEGFLHGRVSSEMLREVIKDFSHKTFMTCGPQALMDMVQQVCTEEGVEEKHIKSESFD